MGWAFIFFPSCWNVHQKVAIATLCTLWLELYSSAKRHRCLSGQAALQVHCSFHQSQYRAGPTPPFLAKMGKILIRSSYLAFDFSLVITAPIDDPQSKKREAMVTFWHTFHHDGKISPPPFAIFTIMCKVTVYAPAERADTPPLFHLYPYVLCEVTSSPIYMLANRFLMCCTYPPGPCRLCVI